MRTVQTRTLAIVLVAVCVAMFAAPACAQMSLMTAPTTILNTRPLTTTDTLSSTFSLPQDCKAVDFYYDLVKGTATSVDFTPCGAINGNPNAEGYKSAAYYRTTMTADDFVVRRIPRSELGVWRYVGVRIRAVGDCTTTTPMALVRYKLEY